MESIKLINYYFKYFNPFLINTDMIRPLVNGELESRQSNVGVRRNHNKCGPTKLSKKISIYPP